MKRSINYRLIGGIGRALVTIPLLIAVCIISVTSDYKLPVTVKKADMNGDGIISSSDVLDIMSLSSGLRNDYTYADFLKADMDGDGIITAADAYKAKSRVSASVTIKTEEETTSASPLVDSFAASQSVPVVPMSIS